jgi:hypothetical protein
MRNFLITKKTYKCGKLAGFEILGMVQGDYSPAFDKETAKKLFGCKDILILPQFDIMASVF